MDEEEEKKKFEMEENGEKEEEELVGVAGRSKASDLDQAVTGSNPTLATNYYERHIDAMFEGT